MRLQVVATWGRKDSQRCESGDPLLTEDAVGWWLRVEGVLKGEEDDEPVKMTKNRRHFWGEEGEVGCSLSYCVVTPNSLPSARYAPRLLIGRNQLLIPEKYLASPLPSSTAYPHPPPPHTTRRVPWLSHSPHPPPNSSAPRSRPSLPSPAARPGALPHGNQLAAKILYLFFVFKACKKVVERKGSSKRALG
jgi:hypothetical protein